VKTLFIKWDYAIKNGALRLINRLMFKRTVRSPKGIVVFRTGSLGDSICSFPALTTLRERYPNATIEILTESGGKSLIGIDKLIAPAVVDGFLFYKGVPFVKLIKELRKNRSICLFCCPRHTPLLKAHSAICYLPK
jgi:3-deoxy-D-manno-octulosonic-acid transferase